MPEETSGPGSDEGKYKQIFRLRALHLLALFIFVYVGTEVTVGGSSRFDFFGLRL